MPDLAAFVVDSEYVDKMFADIYGANVSPDVMKICNYLENAVPGRTLLWTHWYVKEQWDEDEQAQRRRHGYHTKLKHVGIRVIVCPCKPIARQVREADRDTCDPWVAQGIQLAARAANTVIVATGDGHLTPSIAAADDVEGRRIELFCQRRSLSTTIEADRFHFLEEIRKSGIDLTKPRRAVARPRHACVA